MMAEWVFGIHPVRELLKAGDPLPDRIVFRKSSATPAIDDIIKQARELGIDVRGADQAELNRLSENGNHQGVAAQVEVFQYTDIHDLLTLLVENGLPDVLLLDELQDPHNLGALLRSADAFGLGGVVIPKDRSVSVTPTVTRTSAGATNFVPVARVTNLARSMKLFKDAGYWIIGSDAEANTSVYKADLSVPVAFVLGSEGSGMRPLIAKTCDYNVKLPREGRINSLNVSVAGAILMSESFRQKQTHSEKKR